MYQAELNAVSRGITFPELMETAGTECAKIIYRQYWNTADSALILCGKGKNGGDGFVAARVLAEKGFAVKVVLVCGEPAAEDAVSNFNRLESGIEVIRYSGNPAEIGNLAGERTIIVDAIFGTGFKGELSPELSALAFTVNGLANKVIAVDVPSGVDCDRTGEQAAEGICFRADLTVPITACKPIHATAAGRKICGEIIVADIGITEEDIEKVPGSKGQAVSRVSLRKRAEFSNKGAFGHALCVCGSKRMPGAACICVTAALRCGAGLVTAAFPQSAYLAIASKINEALMLPLAEKDGMLCPASLDELQTAMNKATAIVTGCGLGFTNETKEVVYGIIEKAGVPLVIDADAINAVAENPGILRKAKYPPVVTPHPGEMARLCGKTVAEILENKIETGAAFAKEFNCLLVLKDAATLIFVPGGDYYISSTGNDALSKGGSGDMLAGMICSFLAQGADSKTAAVNAVYLHGGVADEVTKSVSGRGVLATDLINYLPVYFKKFD